MTESMSPGYAGEGIYREHILDHYKNPRNSGTLDGVSGRELNPICGDEVTFFLRISDSKITDIRFRGKGCAISQAAASMLTEQLKGKSLEDASAFGREKIMDMLGIDIGPARTKCAVLGMAAVNNAISNYRREHG